MDYENQVKEQIDNYYKNQTLYEVLGLPKYGKSEYTGDEISLSTIQRARERLIYGNQGQDSLPVWQRDRVDRAYSVLSDPIRRREYDQFLANVDSFGNAEPVQEQPVQEQPVQEQPVQEQPVQEQPVQEQPVQEQPVQEQPVQEQPVQEQPVQEQPVQEQPVQEQPVQEQPVQEQPVQEQPVQEQPVQEQPVQEQPVQEQPSDALSEEDKKYVVSVSREVPENTKIKKAAVIIGSAIVGGPAGAVVGIVLASKLFGKAKLQKEKKKKRISKVSVEETQIIENANQQLDNDIYELLSKPNSNYKLAIAKAKYENQVDLLKKRIEFKENQQVKKGGLVKYKLELMALRRQLATSEKRLETLKSAIKEYNGKSKLNTLNKELISSSKEITANKEELKKDKNYTSAERKKMVSSIKKLEIKRTKSQEKRDAKARRMVLNKNGIARNQYYLYAFDVVKNKVGQFFNRAEEVESQPIELEEEVKTR